MAVRPLAAADKVDVVQLRNGDRLTCEIKKLDRSVLAISTDPLGKASVHWGEVATLQSPRTFDIRLASGEQYIGALRAAAQPGEVVVAPAGGTPTTLTLSDVVLLTPIGASVWSRVDGNIDLGFSFAQANLETHLTLNSSATYRGTRNEVGTNLASQMTTREDAARTARTSIGVGWRRYLPNRWYTIGLAQTQQNEELQLDLRVVAGGGVGRELVHTDHRLWSTYGGLVYTHEQFSGEPADQSVEVAVGGQLDFFAPGNDDYNITNSVVSYFNLSRARVRLELQNAWRHEFLKDFYWSLNGFESFDSDPPASDKQNDFGVSFTLGWKF